MPRKPLTICRVCQAPRDPDLKEALCKPCILAVNVERCRKWREDHPDRYRASEAKRVRPERVAKPKRVPKRKPVVVRPYVPQVQVIIGPEAIERVKPVDVRGHKVTRIPAMHGWGR
jgi:hypothetical protein